MRKVFAVLILIILILTFYFRFNKINEKDSKKPVESIGIKEENIVSQINDDYDAFVKKIRKLQENPDQIAELNCMITKLIYSGKYEEEDIELLVNIQREYYTKETLDKNPFSIHIQRLSEEISLYKEAKYFIIGYKLIGPQFVDVKKDEKPKIVFNVIYYMNITTEEGEVFKGYVFEQNNNKLWELKGFGSIDGFPIINN